MLYADARKPFFKSIPKFPVITCNLKGKRTLNGFFIQGQV